MAIDTMHTIEETICFPGQSTKTMRSLRRPKHVIYIGFLPALLAWIGRQSQKRRSRRDLLELTAAQLLDIGITANEARKEASVPFWR